MDQQPQQMQIKDPFQPQIIQQGQQQKLEQMQAEQQNMNEKGQELQNKQYVDQVKIGGETIFTITPEMQNQSNNLVYRQRKSRWGQRKIKRSKIQEDAVFNPLEALYSGNSLLPITQYGQAELDIKLSLYSDGKRHKSKWHHQIEKTFTPPMMNYISPNISVDEVQYLLRLYRLDQLTAKINDFAPDDADIRSPSPQPIYDKDGRRINTRQVRKRDSLHRERIGLIQDCIKMRSSFVPPDDYKPLKKYKKIYLTQTAINDKKANYVGKIIGPQGSTQKLIQKRSGCKIGVRGRGANKHQKDIFENFQPLHIIVVADRDEDLQKGVQQVHNILNGQQDDELEQQLKQLEGRIVLGKLDDNYCQNCQSQGHRTWACPFEMNKNKINIKCSICGQTTHPTADCPERGAYLKNQQTSRINMLLQSQYHQFKSDLNNQNKGQLKFITDEKKDLLAIGSDKSRKPIDKKDIMGQKKKSQGLPVFAPQTDDIPKFQDD